MIAYFSVFTLILIAQYGSNFDPWQMLEPSGIWLSGVLLATLTLISPHKIQNRIFLCGAFAIWLYNLATISTEQAIILSVLQTLEPWLGLQILRIAITHTRKQNLKFKIDSSRLTQFAVLSIALLLGVSGIGGWFLSQNLQISWTEGFLFWSSASLRGAAVFIPLGYAIIWFFAKYPSKHLLKQWVTIAVALGFTGTFYQAFTHGYDSLILLIFFTLGALSLAGPLTAGLTYFICAYLLSQSPLTHGENLYLQLEPLITLFTLSCALIFIFHAYADSFYNRNWIIRHQNHIEVVNVKRLIQWIEKGWLRYEFQPIIYREKSQLKLVSLESLIRLKLPKIGEIPVGAFIEPFEAMISNQELQKKLIKKFSQQLSQFSSVELDYVSVNFSPNHLRQTSIIEHLIVLNKTLPHQLLVEILEQQDKFLKDPILQAHIHQLIDAGVLIALDDFGKEHSNLERLIELPIHYLKIDKMLIFPFAYSKKHQVLVENTANFCHQLGIKVIVEGVENEETALKLESIEVRRQQGFLYSKSLPSHSVSNFSHELKTRSA